MTDNSSSDSKTEATRLGLLFTELLAVCAKKGTYVNFSIGPSSDARIEVFLSAFHSYPIVSSGGKIDIAIQSAIDKVVQNDNS